MSRSRKAHHRAAPASPTWGARKIQNAAMAQAIAPSAVKNAKAPQAAAAEKPFARWASLISVKASNAILSSLSMARSAVLTRKNTADDETGGKRHHQAGERLVFDPLAQRLGAALPALSRVLV